MEISIFGRQYFVNKVLLFAVVVILVIGSGFLGYFLNKVYQPLKEPVAETENIIKEGVGTMPAEEEAEPQKVQEQIKVYIVGCVNKPGVVTLKKGDVIDDAIRCAGGASKDADLENINLAFQLNENTMLRIKSKASGQKILSAPNSTVNSNLNSKADKAGNDKHTDESVKQAGTTGASAPRKSSAQSVMNSGVDIINDSLGALVAEQPESNGGDGSSKLVNINKATQAELEALPNVGPATAKAIIEYREKNGGFKKITDLMKITGIKQKTFDKIKDYICI